MHRLARNDARRFLFDAHALRILDRALAIDGIAKTVDNAAQQTLADWHVHDGAGALDGVAFLDLAVGAEDHDADIVGFKIEGHALHAIGELHHLASLHLVQAVNAGDAVPDAQHGSDFGNLGLRATLGDLVLDDLRKIGRASWRDRVCQYG